LSVDDYIKVNLASRLLCFI